MANNPQIYKSILHKSNHPENFLSFYSADPDKNIFLCAAMLHPALFLQITPAKGRGVFTGEALEADVEIELSPVIVLPGKDRAHLDKTLLHDYIFEWNPAEEKGCCMALGWVALYNHSYTSNCEYEMDYEAETISIKTVRPVAAGEELTINYNGDWNDAAPVWFDVS